MINSGSLMVHELQSLVKQLNEQLVTLAQKQTLDDTDRACISNMHHAAQQMIEQLYELLDLEVLNYGDQVNDTSLMGFAPVGILHHPGSYLCPDASLPFTLSASHNWQKIKLNFPFSSLIDGSEATRPVLHQLLFVMNDHALLEHIVENLRYDFKIITARSAQEAINKTKKYLPDIVISDLVLPTMDGLTFCKTLKNDGDVNHIPVIILTEASFTAKTEALEAGVSSCMAKPVNIRYLQAKVRNLILAREYMKAHYRKMWSLERPDNKANNFEEMFITKLVDAIDKNMAGGNLNVKKLAKKMAMSQSNLYKRVKDITGGGMVDFINSIKIKKAARLLYEGHLNINEVAVEIGISDIKYFRTLFRKYFNQTPSDFVRQIKKREIADNDNCPRTASPVI